MVLVMQVTVTGTTIQVAVPLESVLVASGRAAIAEAPVVQSTAHAKPWSVME
jgi:hypothetical protein